MQRTRGHLDGNQPEPDVLQALLAFKVVPLIGTLLDSGETDEEAKMEREMRKILGVPDLDAVCTCVRVRVARAHGVAATLWFERPVDADLPRASLEGAEGARLSDHPTPRAASSRDDVLVGRLRALPSDARALTLFPVTDQVRKGAAPNALQIADRLVGGDYRGGVPGRT